MRSADTDFFESLTQTTEFLLLRHGESEGNTAGIFQGRKNYPLSAKGRKQAEQAGKALAGNPNTVLFCSPLARARETAELIAKEAHLGNPITSDRLIELETGNFTGRSWHEIKENDPDAWDRFHHESWEGVEGAEKSKVLYERAMSAWELLRDAEISGSHDGVRRVIAVSHAGFLQWLFRTTFGTQTWFPLVSCGNCRVYCLKVERMPSGALTTTWTAMNDTAERLTPPRN